MKNTVQERKLRAVILAGGEGKRLMPLTSALPKPLLKIDGVPVIKNIIAMLSRHGIKKAAVTLGFKGDMIKEALGESFLGVELTYFTEDEPLGSAGGVKKASNFITDDEFIVICGDAMCDFDLGGALDFFYRTGGDGVILCDEKNEDPLEYGIVTSDDKGRVISFVEKPSWSGVCPGGVNTGMYIFKREVLDLIPEGRYDFSYDLFSKMLSMGKSLYAYVINGDWCDIGTISDYYKCNMKYSGGKNVIGQGCQLDTSSKIEKSVISDGVMVGGGCFIDSAVIGEGCVIGENVRIERGAVVGPYSVLGDRCIVKEGALVSQGQVVKSGELVQNPLYDKDIFSPRGIFLFSPDERTLYTLGGVIRKCLIGKRIAVMYDESLLESKGRGAFMLGLCTAEGVTYDIGRGFSALAAFCARTERYDLGLFVSCAEGRMEFRLYDSDGLYPGAAFERLVRHANVCISSMNIKRPLHCVKIQSGLKEKYMDSLIKGVSVSLRGMTATVYISGIFGRMLSEVLEIMGVTLLPYGGKIIISGDEGGEYADIIYDGVFFDFDHIRCVCIAAYGERGFKEITLSHRSSEGLKSFVKKKGMRLGLCAENYYDKKEYTLRRNIPKTPALYDVGSSLMLFLDHALSHNLGGEELMGTLPVFSTKYKNLSLPRGKKQIIARSGENYDKEGFVIIKERGRVRVIPENGDNLSLCAEGGSIEDAAELIKIAQEYIDKKGQENEILKP